MSKNGGCSNQEKISVTKSLNFIFRPYKMKSTPFCFDKKSNDSIKILIMLKFTQIFKIFNCHTSLYVYRTIVRRIKISNVQINGDENIQN